MEPKERTAVLDEFVAEYATPAFRAAGFIRERRSYVAASSQGLSAKIVFRPWHIGDRVGFNGRWDVASMALLEYDRSRGNPRFTTTLLGEAIEVPKHLRLRPFDGTLWLFTNENRATVGEGLRSVLLSELIPRCLRYIDRPSLIEAFSDPDPFSYRTASISRAMRLAAMYVDDGPAEDARRMLDESKPWYPQHVRLGQWLSDRLDARVNGTAVDQN
jgi:hypothetical protein